MNHGWSVGQKVPTVGSQSTQAPMASGRIGLEFHGMAPAAADLLLLRPAHSVVDARAQGCVGTVGSGLPGFDRHDGYLGRMPRLTATGRFFQGRGTGHDVYRNGNFCKLLVLFGGGFVVVVVVVRGATIGPGCHPVALGPCRCCCRGDGGAVTNFRLGGSVGLVGLRRPAKTVDRVGGGGFSQTRGGGTCATARRIQPRVATAATSARCWRRAVATLLSSMIGGSRRYEQQTCQK